MICQDPRRSLKQAGTPVTVIMLRQKRINVLTEEQSSALLGSIAPFCGADELAAGRGFLGNTAEAFQRKYPTDGDLGPKTLGC